ncbi:MAG: hypothetical protein R3Y12_01525 [Clostridia bacterium]
MKDVMLLANLGFAIITPLILSVYGSIWLKNRYNLPDYIIIFGIFFGITTGVYSFCKIAFGGITKK